MCSPSLDELLGVFDCRIFFPHCCEIERCFLWKLVKVSNPGLKILLFRARFSLATSNFALKKRFAKTPDWPTSIQKEKVVWQSFKLQKLAEKEKLLGFVDKWCGQSRNDCLFPDLQEQLHPKVELLFTFKTRCKSNREFSKWQSRKNSQKEADLKRDKWIRGLGRAVKFCIAKKKRQPQISRQTITTLPLANVMPKPKFKFEAR